MVNTLDDSFVTNFFTIKLHFHKKNIRILVAHLINPKNELYFSKISFQIEANGVYISEINIVGFKRRS